MKRFIFGSVIFLMSITGYACGPMAMVHNYYMFNVLPSYDYGIFRQPLEQFWRTYTGAKALDNAGNGTYYGDMFSENCKFLMDAARKKGDREMMAYLRQLSVYLNISEQLSDGWTYPTKKQLVARRLSLVNMSKAAAAYKGKRLRPQYELLYMRANMMLKRYQQNKQYWSTTASKLPESVCRDMAQNIYANALLNLGQRRAACDIYAQQGDETSIQWVLRKFRNIAGIKTIYGEDPKAPTLHYLVQNFVNAAQETIDDKGNKETIEMIGFNAVYRQEIKQFISFADQVVAEGKTDSPCLWKSAVAMLQYLTGSDEAAQKTIDKALTLDGNERMKDNARCIRLLVNTRHPNLNNSKLCDYLTKEYHWLDAKSKEEGSYQSYVRDRVAFQNLIPAYRKAGREEVAAALLGMFNENEYANIDTAENQHSDLFNWDITKDKYGYELENSDYNPYGEYFSCLDSMKAEQLVKYYAYITSAPKNPFESYVLTRVYKNKDYFNDLIGTKYLAEGRFAEARPYLEKVPLTFLNHQNISYYMAHRDFTKDRWFTRQRFSEDTTTDGACLAKLTENPKLKFCDEMIQLQGRYNLAGDENLRSQLAYQLASRYYQSSCYGDCWYLTHYGQSCADSARTFEADFAAKALQLLGESKKSTDISVRSNSLYARAFIVYARTGNSYDYWDATDAVLFSATSNFEIYQAYRELYDYASSANRQNTTTADKYISHCDVLKRFIKTI